MEVKEVINYVEREGAISGGRRRVGIGGDKEGDVEEVDKVEELEENN